MKEKSMKNIKGKLDRILLGKILCRKKWRSRFGLEKQQQEYKRKTMCKILWEKTSKENIREKIDTK